MLAKTPPKDRNSRNTFCPNIKVLIFSIYSAATALTCQGFKLYKARLVR